MVSFFLVIFVQNPLLLMLNLMTTMKKPAIYGLFTGLSVAGWTYLQFLLGHHTQALSRASGLFPIVIILAGLTLGMRAYRGRQQSDGLSYWKAVRAGVILIFFAGLIQAGFTYLYYEQIYPGFVDFLAEKKRLQLTARKLPAARIHDQIAQLRHYHQSGPMALRTLGGFMATGTVFTLIVAALIKRPPKGNLGR